MARPAPTSPALSGRPFAAPAQSASEHRIGSRAPLPRPAAHPRRSCRYPIHPEPGGLVSWGYDHSGDEHFFLPCDPDPERWKIVTMVHETGVEVHDGPFAGFVLAFVNRLRDLDRCHGVDPDALEFLEPEDLEELAASGEIGPIEPSFEPF
ncbi:hypothetical protein [Kitasatospora sp. NPDC057223]|uniref:hypothetical protein n=1 Tax=Kitasatospora sp. NPDC057223 TaxID=3346055 RepID=UPI0036418088